MSLMRNPVFWAADNANLADDNAGLREDVQTLRGNYQHWKAHAQRLEGRMTKIKRTT